MTIRLNPANLTQTRSDLGLAIGTDVLAPNGSGANLTGLAPDLSSDIRALALQTAADRIGLENGIADPFTDNSDVSIDEFIGNFGGNATVGNTHSSDSSFAAQRFTVGATGGTVTQVKFTVQGVAFASGTDIRIETDDGTTTPSGTLVDSNAVLTTSAHSISTNLVTENFPGSFSLAANTSYWIVISRNSTGGYGVYRNTSNGATMGGTGAFINSFNANYELGIYVPINLVGDSVNFTHDATSSSYSSFSTGDMFDRSGITITTSPSFTFSDRAYNNDLTNSAYHAGAPSNSYYQIDLGSGNALSAVSYTVGMWNNGISSQYGTVFNYKLQASADGASFTDIDSRSSVTHNGALSSSQIKYSFSKTTAYRYWRFVIVSSNGTYTGIGNIEIEYADVSNGTLVSNAFTANSAPSSAVIGLQTVESGYCTPNTDFTAEVSRDGGTTFTACTLAIKSTLGASNTKYYESAATDISSQPSGTSIKYRIKTLNNKDIQVHGVALKWS